MRHSTGQASQVTIPGRLDGGGERGFVRGVGGGVGGGHGAGSAASTRSGVAGTRVRRTPVACGDRVQDGGGGGDQGGLADALGAVGAERVGVLDQDGLDRRHVADGRDEIVVQVLGPAGHVFLHQREPEALGDAAVDLALDQRRVDRAADVVGGDDAQHA